MLAANYEFHSDVRSLDPKVVLRVQLAESLALRASVQITFRTPSVDDLNEDLNTGPKYVSAACIYKAIDTHGDQSLVPERVSLEVLYSFEGSGHHIARDEEGNLYTAETGQRRAGSSSSRGLPDRVAEGGQGSCKVRPPDQWSCAGRGGSWIRARA